MAMMPFPIDIFNDFFVDAVANVSNQFINLIPVDNLFNKILTSTIQLLAVGEPFGIISILIDLTKKWKKKQAKLYQKVLL
jgi:hypothetical protein